MVDLSNIDWVKFNKSQNTHRVGALINEIQIVTWSGPVVASRTMDRGWSISCRLHSEALAELAGLCAKVDAFIAAETARIEAEVEAKNWIAVPWQDVEWLRGIGAKVQRLLYGTKDWVAAPPMEPVYPAEPYRVHRDALPAGYDPEKPRWVKIHKDDARRLSDAGARVQRKMSSSNDNWVDMTNTERATRYDHQLDIHTLPAGVPLHEEPKSVPRPCTKEFALLHPRKSEYRYRYNQETEWFNWDGMRTFNDTVTEITYEFRTTAPEKTKHPVVLLEIPMVSDERGISLHFDETASKLIGRLSANKERNPRIALIVDEVE